MSSSEIDPLFCFVNTKSGNERNFQICDGSVGVGLAIHRWLVRVLPGRHCTEALVTLYLH